MVETPLRPSHIVENHLGNCPSRSGLIVFVDRRDKLLVDLGEDVMVAEQ